MSDCGDHQAKQSAMESPRSARSNPGGDILAHAHHPRGSSLQEAPRERHRGRVSRNDSTGMEKVEKRGARGKFSHDAERAI